MNKNLKFVSLILIIIMITSSLTFADYTNISSTIDKDGYYTISTTDMLKPYGDSNLNLPTEIKMNDIEGVSIIRNGIFVNTNITIVDGSLVISPKEYFNNSAPYTIRIFTNTKRYSLSINTMAYASSNTYDGTTLKLPPNPAKGFNYPYYVFLPKGIDANDGIKHMIVEPNNTGSVSDLLGIHDEVAKNAVEHGGMTAHQASVALNTPLLTPVFPRPASESFIYTHDLDRNTMLIKSGEMKRLDLQLIAMIKDAQQLLLQQGVKVEEKVFMTGYSASAKFANKFTIIHPEIVKAVATGGVNAYTILPTSSYNGVVLNYPVGVADLKQLTGLAFNESEYKKVPQFIYMGELDTNDILAPGFDNEEGEKVKATARKILGERMMPDRWNKLQSIYKGLGYSNSIQFHTYKGIGHEINTKTNEDVTKFFKANSGDTIQKITPYEYSSY